MPGPDGQEWDRHLKLSQEKEVLGIYVSDHPLRPFEYALAKARDFSFSQVDTGYEVQNPTGGTINRGDSRGQGAVVGRYGLERVQARDQKQRPHGHRAARGHGRRGHGRGVPQDLQRRPRVSVRRGRSETGAQLSDAFMRIKGKLERSDRGDQIIAQEIVPLELSEGEQQAQRSLRSWCPTARFSQGNMARLATVLTANPGGDARGDLLLSRWTGACSVPRCRSRSTHARFRCWQRQKAIVGNQGRVTVIPRATFAGPREIGGSDGARGRLCRRFAKRRR